MISERRSSRDKFERAGFILFVCIALMPIGIGLLYALAYTLGLAGLLSRGFTLEYWGRLGENGEIWWAFAMSIGIAVSVVAASLLLALLLALPLRGQLQRGILSYAIYLPLALPGTVLAFITFQALSGAGLVSRLMAGLGLIHDPVQFPGLIHDPIGIGIFLAEAAVGTPFFMILLAQIYQSEHLHDLSGLARNLGAGRRKVFSAVVLPLLLQRAFPTVVLYLVGVLGAYEVPLLLGAQSPQMISVLTMRKYAMFDLAQKPEAFICAILYTCLSLVLIRLAYRGRGDADET